MMRMLRAFEDVNKIHSAQHFITFWTNIHSKLMLQFVCGFLLHCTVCHELIVNTADFEAALTA